MEAPTCAAKGAGWQAQGAAAARQPEATRRGSEAQCSVKRKPRLAAAGLGREPHAGEWDPPRSWPAALRPPPRPVGRRAAGTGPGQSGSAWPGQGREGGERAGAARGMDCAAHVQQGKGRLPRRPGQPPPGGSEPYMHLHPHCHATATTMPARSPPCPAPHLHHGALAHHWGGRRHRLGHQHVGGSLPKGGQPLLVGGQAHHLQRRQVHHHRHCTWVAGEGDSGEGQAGER